MITPIIYDPHCPLDCEHDYLNVRLVGDKSKATHEAMCLIVGPGGQHLRVDTRPIPAPPQHYVRPLRAEPERMEVKWEGAPPPPSLPAPVGQHPTATEWGQTRFHAKGDDLFFGECHITGGAAWTGEKAKQMMEGGRSLIPQTWPDLPGVPKPDWDFTPPQPVNHELTSSPSIGSDPDEMALRSFVAIQRENTAVRKLTADEREAASAAWSAQLRAKVEERKKADAETARVTPYWSPEEQSGGDL